MDCSRVRLLSCCSHLHPAAFLPEFSSPCSLLSPLHWITWTLPSQTIDASSEANSCSAHQGLVEMAEDRRDAPAHGMLMSKMGEHDEVDEEEEEGGGGGRGRGP